MAAGDLILTVTDSEMVEFDGNVSELDRGIVDLQSIATLPDGSNMNLSIQSSVAVSSLKLRWKAFFMTWNAWRDAHALGLHRMGAAVAVDFGHFKVEYNNFRAELIALGGKAAPPASTTPPPPSESKTDSVVNTVGKVTIFGIVALVIYKIVTRD